MPANRRILAYTILPDRAATVRTCEEMRPQAGGGKLKHAPPMRVNDLPVVAQAVPPANYIFSQLVRERWLTPWQACAPSRSRLGLVPAQIHFCIAAAREPNP